MSATGSRRGLGWVPFDPLDLGQGTLELPGALELGGGVSFLTGRPPVQLGMKSEIALIYNLTSASVALGSGYRVGWMAWGELKRAIPYKAIAMPQNMLHAT